MSKNISSEFLLLLGKEKAELNQRGCLKLDKENAKLKLNLELNNNSLSLRFYMKVKEGADIRSIHKNHDRIKEP